MVPSPGTRPGEGGTVSPSCCTQVAKVAKGGLQQPLPSWGLFQERAVVPAPPEVRWHQLGGGGPGAELSAGGRDQVSSPAPASLRAAPASAAQRKLTAPRLLSSPAQNAGAGTRSAWDPGTLDGRKPQGMDGPQPRPAHLTSLKPLVKAGPGARERRTVNLGGLKSPEPALGTSWANVTQAPPPRPRTHPSTPKF